jgi:branched-chain amino acid aminotransferase
MFEPTYFPKAKKFWQMGKIVDWSEATIHAMTHALHYGNAVFEGIRAYDTDKGPAIFRLPEHMERFEFSSRLLNMDLPYTTEETEDIIKLVMKENKLSSAYIRPLLFYSYGNLGLVPKASPVELMVSAWEWGAYLGEKAETGVSIYILPWRRIHHSQVNMTAKLGGLYVLSTMGGIEARRQGYDEALYLNLEGNVAEGPGENIFVVKDGGIKTNDRSESILQGITRGSILKIAEDNGIPTEVGPITREELFSADEAFFSGTAVELTPIAQVTDDSHPDERPASTYTIGKGKKGPVTERLRTLFYETVQGKRPEYLSWLTYVYD